MKKHIPLLAAAGVLAFAIPASADSSGDVLSTFPYRHVSVVQAWQAPGTPAPPGTLWVNVDDGAAVPRQGVSRAIPADGSVSKDAAFTDPANCERIGNQPGVCWRYLQRVGDEVRIWTTDRGVSCVLLASLNGKRARLNCNGAEVSL